MSLLSDRDILRAIDECCLSIDPLPDSQRDWLQPASIDLRLGSEFKRWPSPGQRMAELLGHNADCPECGSIAARGHVIDPMQEPSERGLQMLSFMLNKMGDTFAVMPGQFVLAHTIETIGLGDELSAQIYGKSSIGRVGLRVENAGYIDPGFIGQITLELRNETQWPIVLTVGMPICQIVLHRLTTTPVIAYGAGDLGSRYQGQQGATPSRYGVNRQLPQAVSNG